MHPNGNTRRSPEPPVERHCLICGAPFRARISNIRRGGGRFCSLICVGRHKARPTKERFWARVQKSDGCWLWAGRLDHYGYGWLDRSRSEVPTGTPHRQLAQRASHLSWELHYGPIPEGQSVLHKCDTPACVRPDHLFVGTQADNMHDMAAKGRAAHGTRKPNAKLTDASVSEYRRRYRSENITVKQLAAEAGVSVESMAAALRGKTWAHVS